MNQIEKARQMLAESRNVDPEYLDYIGASDMSCKGEGFVQYNFNIMDENHPNFKSTIIQDSWAM